MARKVFWVILIPALLILAGYLALQIYLRSSLKQESREPLTTAKNSTANAARPGQEPSAIDSLGGKNVSALDLRPLFLQKLQQLVTKSTNGVYQLSVGDMKVDVLSSQVSLHAVTLRPDAQVLKQLQAAGERPDEVYTVSFDSLQIDGINLDDALTSKTMDYRLVKLAKPVIRIDRYSSKNQQSRGNFEERFLQNMEKLAIDRLVVEDASITIRNIQKGTSQTFNKVEARLKNILLNESTRGDRTRFLFAKEATLQLQDFAATSADGLYRFKIRNALINATAREIRLNNLQFGPTLSRQAFMKKQSRAKEMYTLSLASVTLHGVDWWPALNGEAVKAGLVQTRGGRLSVYFDRSLPLRNKMGNFPNQLLQKAPLAVAVNKLQVRDLDIAYEEFNPVSKQSGTVYFDKADLNVTNIRRGSKQPMVVEGSALLMRTVPLKATFRFSMAAAKEGAFTAAMHTSGFSGSVMNPVTRPLGMLNIDKGEVQQLAITVKGDQWGASGNVLLLYKDLKLSLLEKNKEGKGLNDRDVFSFLANTFVIKNDNPRKQNGKAEKKAASFKRDPESGFMNLVWKTAFVGILKTMGAPEKMAQKQSSASQK